MKLGGLMGMMGERGLVALLAALAGACTVAGIIPSFSTIIGMPMLFLSIWLAGGGATVSAPVWIERKEMEGKSVGLAFRKAASLMRRIERYATGRSGWVFTFLGRRSIGILCVMMSALVLLPIPFMNFIPSIAMAIVLIGWLERDGLLTLVGFGIGCLGISTIPILALIAL